jgi:muconolactone D-isomerase
MEFLVRQSNRAPRELLEQLEPLRVQERAYAGELRERGILCRLWRVPGTMDAIGLYEVESTTALHTILAALPMFRWLEITIEPLATHPQEQAARAAAEG